ncbi:MAG: phosphoribosylglycinamide formyltransferase [Euryarchaeota archaeon]|jgi:phosphoribosylglycinamide formyltransferase-1|nr:phosphoribosylglycinamide formyltransferase [Euryarchaeota archaeon]
MAEQWVLPRIGTTEKPLRICTFISGSGSGMEALLNYQIQNNTNHRTILVISDRPEAEGLQKAKSLGCKSITVPLPDVEDKSQRRRLHENAINKILLENEVELIVLSGYMRILTSEFVKPWAGRILNIHPSLLPDFPGAHAHRDVISAGVKKSGCTVHFVDSGMDTGPIIAQKEVEVLADDDESSLGERIKIEEHKLYPKVIDQLAAGEIQSP